MRAIRAICWLAVLALALYAPLPSVAQAVGDPVLPGIWRLQGNDPGLPLDDLEALRPVIGKATVVGIGESVHTSGGFYRMKHRVFRYLVERMGFRVFAMENPWQGSDELAAYVQTCAGTPDEPMRRLFGVWRSEEVRDLIEWMCEWNRSHPKAKDRVSFFGFDIQQPQDDGPALIAFLERIGAADGTWVADVNACDGVVVRNPAGAVPEGPHAQCLAGLERIDEHFRKNAKKIQKQTSKKDFEIAKLRLIGLRAWENETFYYRSDYSQSFDARDQAMAYAFQTLRALRFPKTAKVALWAHNAHISKGALREDLRPMGSHLAASLGRSFVSLGLTAYDVAIDWPGFNCGSLAQRLNGSMEQKLKDLGEEFLFVDLKFPGTDDPYIPPGPLLFADEYLDPRPLFDGILYLERSPKMSPLGWPSCQ